MAIGPHNDDPNKDKVKKHINDLKKESTGQAADKLKEEFNIDVDGKDKVKPATPADAAKAANK